MSWGRALGVRLRHLFRPQTQDDRVDEEIQFHLEMETSKNIRAGLSPAEARRRALIAFGGIEKHREVGREVRGMAWVPGAALDLKLGTRILKKSPGLTLVGLAAITAGVGISVAFLEFTLDMGSPSIPLEDADRIVTVRNWDLAAANLEWQSLHDFVAWRDQLRSVRELAAYTELPRTLTTAKGRYETVEAVEITASGLAVPRIAPLLGRPLLDADAAEGAPPVVVIGYSVWQSLFEADPQIIGRTVRTGPTGSAQVVGVMPEGFSFPINHQIWLPLSTDTLPYERREGPAIRMFGRLAPGYSMSEAQAELAAIGQRTAVTHPATNEQLRPQVRRYFEADGMLALFIVNLGFLAVMALLCASVATLFFARTAMREAEIAIRSALGASRRRIVAQLFTEALVLVSAATALGAALAWWGLRAGMKVFWEVQQSRPPFWWNDSLSLRTLVYIGALAIIGAALVGVVPALKVTGKRVHPVLSRISTGSSGLRIGALSTILIVLQVGLSVAILPAVASEVWDTYRKNGPDQPFPADHYLTARIVREPTVALPELTAVDRADFERRSAELFEEVRQRLLLRSDVSAVSFATRLPGLNDLIEPAVLEGELADRLGGGEIQVRSLGVDPSFFETMDAGVLAGRFFEPGEFGNDARVVMVNQTFVQDMTGQEMPVGTYVRYPRHPGADGLEQYEIIGVVDNLAMDVYGDGARSTVYFPRVPGEGGQAQLFVTLHQGASGSGHAEMERLVSGLDPSLRLDGLGTVREAWAPAHRSVRIFTLIMAAVAGITTLLATAGIYALMSFAVSRRTREIGIRVALGAGANQIITSIFGRVLLQLGMGVGLGSLSAYLNMQEAAETETPLMLLTVAVTVLLVGLAASAVPVRRALRIQPIEAVKSPA